MKPSIFTLLVLLAVPSFGVAQGEDELSLPDIISYAWENHPRIATNELLKQAASRSYDIAKGLPPTDFSTQFGELDSRKMDYQLSVIQSLGNPQYRRLSRQKATLQTDLIESDGVIFRQKLKRDIRQTWLEMQFWHLKATIYKSYAILYDSLLIKAQIQLDAGEISSLHYQYLAAQKINYSLESDLSDTERSNAENTLKNISYLPNDQAIMRISDLPDWSGQSAVQIDSLHLRSYELSKNQAQKDVQIHESLLRPEWSFGYLIKSLEGGFAFQAGQASIKIPLAGKGLRARVDQMNLMVLVRDSEIQTANNDLNRRMQSLLDQERRFRERGQQLQNLQTHLDDIKRGILFQLENGEISYLDYVRGLESVLDNEIRLLDIRKKLIETVIEIDYLSNPTINN